MKDKIEELAEHGRNVQQSAMDEMLRTGSVLENLRWHNFELMVDPKRMVGYRFEIRSERTEDGGMVVRYTGTPVKLEPRDLTYPPED